MCIQTNEMHKFLWIDFIFSLNVSTCFGLSLVHHQEQHLISCAVQLVHAIAQPDVPACTNCTAQFIKCCSCWWTNDSPKHVETFNEKIKSIHKNLCISLVCIDTPITPSYHMLLLWSRRKHSVLWKILWLNDTKTIHAYTSNRPVNIRCEIRYTCRTKHNKTYWRLKSVY